MWKKRLRIAQIAAVLCLGIELVVKESSSIVAKYNPEKRGLKASKNDG